MKNKIKKKDIINVVAKSLMINKKKIGEDTHSKDIDKWDSLGSMRIMFGLEKKFKIKINEKYLEKLNSIKSIEKILNN
tara:strand:+ start:155 stop:388 length:234 start_codon:yes stop_codon:yes gene_type:complete